MVSECGAVLTVTFTTPVSPMVLSFLFAKMTMTMRLAMVVAMVVVVVVVKMMTIDDIL